ncbi:MAG: hypothetical protein LBI19_00265 [Oscillospiraceae bacterium]|nr:hypothetical protein [Oscillospiraceae bacterium]
MSAIRMKAVEFIRDLPEDKLSSAVDYLRYLSEQGDALDDFDYELAKMADEDTDGETVSFDALLQEVGLTYADL